MGKLVIYPDEPFGGFVNYFTIKSKGNISKYIIAEGEMYSNFGPPSTTIDYSITGTDRSDQWVSPQPIESANIVYTFKYPLFLTHYTMKTRTDVDGSFQTDWLVECSNDKKKWTRIDTKNNINDFAKVGDYFTYQCDKPSIYAKYVRFNLTSVTYRGCYHFHISRMEFFGRMLTNDIYQSYSIKPKFSIFYALIICLCYS